MARRRRFSVSTSSFAFLKAKLLMDTGTMLELDCTLVNHLTEARFGFPLSSTLTSLNKLTNATCDFLETTKVWAGELIVNT